MLASYDAQLPRFGLCGHNLLLALPNELCPERIRRYVANQGTKDFQPGRHESAWVQEPQRTTYHFAFSSSESAKNRISCSEGKTSLKERSTAINESKSSLFRPSGLSAADRASWVSSTAMAFFKLIVAMAFFVTSLNAIRLAPITLNIRRRQVWKSERLRSNLNTGVRQYSLYNHHRSASAYPQSM